MKLEINIGVPELVELIMQLPNQEREKVKELVWGNSKTKIEDSEFTKFLLKGPVMDKEEERRFKEINKEFEEWEKSLYR